MGNKQYTTKQKQMARRLYSLKQSDRTSSKERKSALERHYHREMIINLIEMDLNKI